MKKTVAILATVLLLLPLHAAAMTQVIFGPQGVASLTSNGTRYYGFHNGGVGGGGTISNFEVPTAVSGVVSELVVKVSSGIGGTGDVTFDLMVNGSPAAGLSCNVPTGGTGCSDLTGSVSVSAGDRLTWRGVYANGVTSGGDIYLTAKFVPTSDGESLLQGQTTANVINNATSYIPIIGASSTTTPEHASTTMPTAGTIDQFYMRLSGSPTAGNSYTYTLFKNGVATNVDCTIADAASTCEDTTDSVSYVAGDSLYIRSEISGTPTARIHKWSFRFRPTTNGESLIFLTESAFSAVTRWNNIFGPINTRDTGEAITQASTTVTWVARDMYYTNIYAPPTGVTARTNVLRINGANSILAPTMTSTDTFVIDTDEVTVTAGDLFNYQDTPTGSPINTSLNRISMVSFVDPGSPPAADYDDGPPLRFFNGSIRVYNGRLIIE